MIARRIGRYLIGDRLGAGGMGTVFAAVQKGPMGLERLVAFKELHPHLARDADFVAMLLNEARVQSALDHPNVVPVLDAIAENGELFLVLAVVDGVSAATVAQHVREHGPRMPRAVAVGIVCDVLEGLHAAHELRARNGSHAGVVHRDVSPHNVMIGADGIARVLDFGIAKAVARSQQTRGGGLKGKPAYMSPEQLAGKKLDRRSDIYSVGVVAAELIIGARMHASTEVDEIQRALGEELADPREWLEARGVEAALAAALGTCLAPLASDRPASARLAALAIDGACRRASASEIAEWLATELGEALAERRSVLTRARLAAASEERTEPTEPGPRTAVDEAGTSLHRRRRYSKGGVALALTGLAISAAAFTCGRASMPTQLASASPASEVRRADSPPLGASSASRVDAPTRVSPAPDSSAEVDGREARAAIKLAAEASPAKRVAHSPSAPSSASSPVQPKAGACDPPYRVDPAGVRMFKMECL